MKRTRRQATCRCDAYAYPHRMFGGRCDGYHIVAKNAGGAQCATCLLNNVGCEVMRGQESPRECAYVIDIMIWNEVKL